MTLQRLRESRDQDYGLNRITRNRLRWQRFEGRAITPTCHAQFAISLTSIQGEIKKGLRLLNEKTEDEALHYVRLLSYLYGN